jgi:hypothetical protein
VNKIPAEQIREMVKMTLDKIGVQDGEFREEDAKKMMFLAEVMGLFNAGAKGLKLSSADMINIIEAATEVHKLLEGKAVDIVSNFFKNVRNN